MHHLVSTTGKASGLILHISNGDMFKDGEIFNSSHSVSQYQHARTLSNPAKLLMATSSVHESPYHEWPPVCKGSSGRHMWVDEDQKTGSAFG